MLEPETVAPETVRRGRHVAAVLAALAGLPGVVKEYRAASHLSRERARRRVLACARLVTGLEARCAEPARAKPPGTPRGMAREVVFQGLELGAGGAP